jgi:hypothetical protein
MWIGDLQKLVGNDVLAGTPTLVPFTLHSGQSVSDAVAVPNGKRPISLAIPSGWEDSDLTFQAGFDSADGTFFEVQEALSTVIPFKLTGGGRAGTLLYFPVWQTARAPFIRVRSGTVDSPATQSGDRILNLVCITCAAADH